MRRITFFIYGALAYGAFFVTIVYAIGFLGNFAVPKSIDTGVEGPIGQAIFINVLLLALFAVQHTIMARPGFKSWWTKIIPKPIERSTFVLTASLLLGLVFWQWRPMKTVVWQIDDPVLRTLVTGLFFLGWGIVFYSSFLIDHFDLFGLRQVFLHLRGRAYSHPQFAERSLYKWIRHPLMAGFLIAFWSAPTMTQGHLLFVVVTTAYIFFGIRLEERDIARFLGEDYRRYRERTPMILPFPGKKKTPAATREKWAVPRRGNGRT